jgi:hypothetical protein
MNSKYIIENFKEIFDKMDEEREEAEQIIRENRKEIRRLRKLGVF